MNASGSYTVGYIVGSLAAESMNRTLSKALIRLAPDNLSFVEIPIRDLPLYNRDFDADYPPVGQALKDAIAAVDAVLFVTPEYNRGLPACLKNAIDWASRPMAPTHWPKAIGGDRRLTRQDWNRARPTTSAQCTELLQLTTAECAGGLHPIHSGADHRRRGGDR